MNNSLTEIVFILDRSGSMVGLESDTIGGYNGFLRKQGELPGRTIATTVLFDDKYELLWSGINWDRAVLTEKEYYVRGRTALLDAVGKTIIDVGCRLSTTHAEQRPGKVIFVIITDGLENASTEFTYTKVRELIGHQRQKYNWEFVFLGANIDSVKEAGNIGISEADAHDFDSTPEGVRQMYCSVCESVSEKRSRE